MIVDMRDAYLKVLGLDQKPLDEAKAKEDEPEGSEVVDTCEECGKVHEGACSEGWMKKEELSPKQKKIDHNKNGKIDGEDLAKLRNEGKDEDDEDDDDEEDEDEDEMKESSDRKMELRSDEKKVGGEIKRDKKPPFDGPYSDKKVAVAGKHGYGASAAKHLAKQGMKAHEEIEIEQFAADLAENGFPQDEIDAMVARLTEKAHVGTGGPAPAEPQEMGDNLSDGELDFIDKHDVEIVDGTPVKPDFDKDVDQAAAPKTKGVGTAEVDGKKIVSSKPEVAVKSQAKVGK